MPGTLAQTIQYGKEEKPFIEAHGASNGLALEKSRKSSEIEGRQQSMDGPETDRSNGVSRFTDSYFSNPAGVGRISRLPSHAGGRGQRTWVQGMKNEGEGGGAKKMT
ncbi:predicted protein [Histoplasma capsulatum G186AR]|uniref:Uncharacterized protein n=1 Tax=Ajellomyces capsulatus (strain G186AR / H82 / ATCC MYA-2454 / RMSCC 2432) TaxID=447093 RepID=C0NY80_AJECG|nr:uncharacterized protein HCBG_07874 [Histoplasma capsulatum G186AR]EEH03748.1 predicted protein [Histoplasma capsulatum G186AR]